MCGGIIKCVFFYQISALIAFHVLNGASLPHRLIPTSTLISVKDHGLGYKNRWYKYAPLQMLVYRIIVRILYRLWWEHSASHRSHISDVTWAISAVMRAVRPWYEDFSFWNISSISRDLFVWRWECKSRYTSHYEELTLFHSLVKGLPCSERNTYQLHFPCRQCSTDLILWISCSRYSPEFWLV